MNGSAVSLAPGWMTVWRKMVSMVGLLNEAKPVAASRQVVLAKESFEHVNAAQYPVIRCVKGAVWITKTGCQDDVMLRTGERVELEHSGEVLIEALVPSQVLLERRK